MEATPNEQLDLFEKEYQAKRRELEGQLTPEAVLPSEHETMSRVVEGKIQEQVPDFQAPVHQEVPSEMSDDLTPETRAKIRELVNIAFSAGLYQSIKALKDSDSALVDEYHSALTGELYKVLVEKKKLEEVK